MKNGINQIMILIVINTLIVPN